MTGEICMFDKFGFCKERERCERTHLVEVCVQEECDARKCDKRHPRACKYHQQNGFCKFKSNCKYGHKQFGSSRDQNLRIEALEKQNEKLTKLIEDQNEAIKDLRHKMMLEDSLKIKQLERDIENLKTNCNEKSEIIRKLTKDVTFLKDEVVALCDSVYENYVPHLITNETNEEYVTKSIAHLEAMEGEIKKCRKNGKDLCVKFTAYCDKLDNEMECAGKISFLYRNAVDKLKECQTEHNCEFSNDVHKKTIADKDDMLKHIDRCKKSFKTLLQD